MRKFLILSFLVGFQCIYSQKNAIGINFAPIYTLSIIEIANRHRTSIML